MIECFFGVRFDKMRRKNANKIAKIKDWKMKENKDNFLNFEKKTWSILRVNSMKTGIIRGHKNKKNYSNSQ